MRSSASLLVLAFALAACQHRSTTPVQQTQPVAGQSTSDVPPRGVEAPNPRTIARPADAGPDEPSQARGAAGDAADAGVAPEPGPKGGAAAAEEKPAGAAPGAPDDAERTPCATDDDCSLTRVGPGSCCETLCQGRPVTKKRAQDLAANTTACEEKMGHQCAVPLCRPPRMMLQPVCKEGRCGIRSVRVEE